MSLLGFSLVLAAAFCHATWNFLVKRIAGGPELVWLFSAIAAVLYLPVALYLFLTMSAQLDPWAWGFVFVSAALHMAYFLLLQQGYRRGDLSLVYPTARATGPFLSTTFAVLVLGETMTVQIAVGALIVIIGVVSLTGGLGRGGRRRVTASVGFGLGAGFLIGGYTVWDAYTVAALAVPPILLDYASTLLRTVTLAPVAWRRAPDVAAHWRRHRAAVIAIAVFNPLAYILVLYALTFTPVVYVAPTREIGVLLTVLMGSIWLGEGDLRRRFCWAGVILVGIALLTTG